MLNTRDKSMGRFCVTVELANNCDLDLVRTGHLPADQVRRQAVKGWVDSGASRLVLPASVVSRLGLPFGDPMNVRYADGRTRRRRTATGVYLCYGGRSGVFTAVVEPDRDEALIGAIVLEDLDFVVDCRKHRLVPRDPERIIAEIE
jgi:predicted aspartyl protease